MKRTTLILALLIFASGLAYGQVGYLDNTFGDGGHILLRTNTQGVKPYAIETLPDGRILHCGRKAYDSSMSKFYLMMHQSDGKLDPSFGNNGYSPVPAVSNYDLLYLTTYNDGRILVYGNRSTSSTYKGEPFIARFLPNGSIDSSFGNDGMYMDHELTHGGYFRKVKIHDDGSLTAIGGEKTSNGLEALYFPLMAKITSDGKRDVSFGNNGSLRIGSEIDTGYIYDVLLTKSGHVVIPLSLKDSPRGALSMLKCDVNGVMDSTFGGNGRGGSQLSDNIEMIYSISETPDQNILCTILLVIQNYYRPLLVQFTKKGSLDASFGDHGVVGSIDSLPTAYFHQCAIDSNGDIIIPGSTYLSDSTYAHCIIRYHKDGRLDSSFGTNGIVICAVTTPSYMPNGIADIAIGNDGKYLMAGILRCTDVGIVAEQGILYRVNNKAVASVYSSSALSQPISQFPSPSTDNCTITYTLPSSSQCTITLRDESGREVRKFATDEYRTAGEHKEELDLRGLASGAYFLQIESNDLIQTAKLIKQ